ncbi:MAG: hypothetical protein GY708_09350, partial [Actinomycetia bacterium]|nr:hypothetical protein [Actinomycetes bacterium]
TLTVTGSGTSLAGDRLDAATSVGSTGSIIIEESGELSLVGSLNVGAEGDGDLTVRSGATAFAGSSVDIGVSDTATGIASVTGNNSVVSTTSLQLGGEDFDDNGGVGTLLVDNNGAVQASMTKFWTSASSITIDGGRLETATLKNHTDVEATVSLSDPAGSSALTVGTNDGTSTFDGLIQDATGGPGSLLKTGTGTFTLNGDNTYTGGTTIDGGTLFANNTSGSATGTGAVNVNSGGTLGGTGSVGGTVNNDGVIAPGTSAGILTVGNVVFESGSTFDVELAGNGGVAGADFDQLFVTSTATINGGTLDLSYINAFTAAPGDSFVILDAGTLSGTFDTVISPDGQTWFIDYDYGADTITVNVCADDDGDGVCNADDICPGFDDNVDTDGDGIPDGCDICPGFDDNVDTDGDGIPDGCDDCPDVNVHNVTQG